MFISTKEYIKNAKKQIKKFKKDGRRGTQHINFGTVQPTFKQIIEILNVISKNNSCSIQMYSVKDDIPNHTPYVYVNMDS